MQKRALKEKQESKQCGNSKTTGCTQQPFHGIFIAFSQKLRVLLSEDEGILMLHPRTTTVSTPAS